DASRKAQHSDGRTHQTTPRREHAAHRGLAVQAAAGGLGVDPAPRERRPDVRAAAADRLVARRQPRQRNLLRALQQCLHRRHRFRAGVSVEAGRAGADLGLFAPLHRRRAPPVDGRHPQRQQAAGPHLGDRHAGRERRAHARARRQAVRPLLKPHVMAQDFGSKRLVVGAHYGLRDWLSQRITAAVMALYTLLLVAQLLFGPKLGYERWSAIFSQQWMRFATLVVIVSLALHAWVGMRDIWMDYIKPMWLRLLLQVATIVWLVGCTGWAVQVLWRL